MLVRTPFVAGDVYSIVPAVESLAIGVVLFVAASFAYRPSRRAHRALSIVYVVVIVDAALWIVVTLGLLVWGALYSGPSEGVLHALGVMMMIIVAVRLAWMAGKVTFFMRARRMLASEPVEAWLEAHGATGPTKF
ncbi:MAG: hypothetical protein AB8I08_41060 [Sandaracinaceae bacterium]